MQFNLKNYQNNKTKNILKKSNFLFFTIGANQSSQNWITLEQSLYKSKLIYHKTYNTITIKVLKNSIFKNLKATIKSTFFFLKPIQSRRTLIKANILNALNFIQFTTLILKLNKKSYAVQQLNTINSFHYKKNISIMYQFLITTLKSSKILKKKR
jgi:hypothetical protein